MTMPFTLRLQTAGRCAQGAAFRAPFVPALSAEQETHVIFAAMVTFLAGACAVALHALSFAA